MVVFGTNKLVLTPRFSRIEKGKITPINLYSSLCEEFGSENTFLLESANGPEKSARYSFIGLNPFISVHTKGREIEIESDLTDYVNDCLKGIVHDSKLIEGHDPLDVIKALTQNIKQVSPPILPRFSGGAVGFLSYENVNFFEDVKVKGTPENYFVFPRDVICFDSLSNDILIFSPEKGMSNFIKKGRDIEKEFSLGKPKSNFTKEAFEKNVKDAKEYILSGDIFQVVLSQRFSSEFNGNPLSVYALLREINPSPYMYFLNFKGIQIAGSSPETLVRVENRLVNLRPIAGTRARGAGSKDKELELELLKDEKERAEHVMLVDLGRNDIGKVCRYGSVRVDEFMVVEKYSHVQHIVSNVSGLLREDEDAFGLLRACFPAGTVTGSPKVRAMEIIDELEGEKRGPYAGVVGYFDYSGNMDTAITIRSLVFEDGKVNVQAGAGIVYDSDPKKEYDETVNKCKAMFTALGVKV